MRFFSSLLEIRVDDNGEITLRRHTLFLFANFISFGFLRAAMERLHGDVVRQRDTIRFSRSEIERIVLCDGVIFWLSPHICFYATSGRRYLAMFPNFLVRRPRYYRNLRKLLLGRYGDLVEWRHIGVREYTPLGLQCALLVVSVYFFAQPGLFLLGAFFAATPAFIILLYTVKLPLRTGFLAVIIQFLPRLPELTVRRYEVVVAISLASIMVSLALLEMMLTKQFSVILLIGTSYLSFLGYTGLSGVIMRPAMRKYIA